MPDVVDNRGRLRKDWYELLIKKYEKRVRYFKAEEVAGLWKNSKVSEDWIKDPVFCNKKGGPKPGAQSGFQQGLAKQIGTKANLLQQPTSFNAWIRQVGQQRRRRRRPNG